ncbi:MAG TPA: aldehyde dehydrogenase family protein [Jatrophihabitans sp.]|jgi:acyl-CoA reductase-like NAD-dependent aldehyde dehydrogenase
MTAVRTPGSSTEYRLLIGGELVTTGPTFEVLDPATEEVVGLAPEADAGSAEEAAAAAAAAFDGWSRTAPEERAAILERAADLVAQRRDELADLAQRESGCTVAVARNMHVAGAIDRLRRYARGALEPTITPIVPQVPPRTSPNAAGGLVGALAMRRPVGVVACITPYNAPMPNTAGKVGAALAMGNTVVIKPAAQDPLAVLRLAEILREAGAPAGVVNVVTESGTVAAEALVASPHVDMVSFTGSTAVGQRIAAVAAPAMKRLLLELGGKGNAIVFHDADLQAAISGIASTWTFYSGQICTAPTRVLVHRSVHDELVARLAAAADSLAIGDPRDAATAVGPLVSGAQRDRVELAVAQAVAGGAELCTRGGRPDQRSGYYVRPALFAQVTAEMPVAAEEIFGPVVAVLAFDDEDEAVALANSTRYGLYDYVYSANTARALDVSGRLRTGGVGINTIQRNAEAPFGGVKLSGVGRDGGSYALAAYSELQGVVYPA